MVVEAGVNTGQVYQYVYRYKTLGYNGLINKIKRRQSKDSKMKATKNILSRNLNESEYEELIRLQVENAYIKTANEVKKIILRE